MKDQKQLKQIDLRYLWHPYTDIDEFEKIEFPIFTKGQGSYLEDVNKKKYIDGISSWWCVNFGHSRPELIKAIRDQSSLLQHSIIGGASNDKAILLAEKINSITPFGLTKSFFCSDGSSAVESGLRIARQYWVNKKNPNKTKFISLEDGYHGDTMGCISVGYIDSFHKELKSSICSSYKAKSPHCAKCPFGKKPNSCNAECFDSMSKLIEEKHHEVAGVIVEPLCQGAAGIRIYSPKYLQKLETECKKYNILLIVDEVATGLYRTGSVFASTLSQINPDIMILGKALTGGYLPMSVAITSEKIFDTFRKSKTLYYGHTFAGNPIAANLAIASLELNKTLNIEEVIKPKSKIIKKFFNNLQSIIPDSFANSLGMIGAIEMPEKLNKTNGAFFAKAVCKRCTEKGLFLRSLSNTVYLWPPLTIELNTLHKALDILQSSIEEEYKYV